MKVVSKILIPAVVLTLTVGCGGAEDAPAPGTPAEETAVPTPPDQDQGQDQDQVQASTQLVREEFAYRGGARDPFLSLVRPGGEDRPRVVDLKVVTILYDGTYPVRSVAVVRDTVEGVRYELRVDDELGRFRVAEIRPRELVVAIDEFGEERLIVLSVRSLQEEAQ
jgi:hypothetical protein